MSIRSWLSNKLILLFQYILIQYKGFRFNYDAKNALKQQINRKTLFEILQQNQKTKLLREQMKKMNLDRIENVESFRKLFPNCTTYEDYKPYIEEITNNGAQKDIMGMGYPIALTNTSGTSGEPKSYPVYSLDINEALIICYMLTKAVPFNLFNGPKAVVLNSLHYKTHQTKDQLKSYEMSAISAIAARQKQNIETLLNFNQEIVPSVIFRHVSDTNDMFLLTLLWALQHKDLEVLSAVFIMGLVNLFTFMEKKFDLICKHIELGTLPSDDLFSSPLPTDVRRVLESSKHRLTPNPLRAEELRQIVRENGFHHINRRIWPNLKCGICIISENLKQYELKFLDTYWDPAVPIYPYVYGMSEHHRIAVPLEINAYKLTPFPRSVYYEFIEVENDDDDDQTSPETLELGQLEEGKLYEVVFTTFDGLYRYRTEDIVKVTGHYHQLPVWKLFGRVGQYLSIADEHVTEIALREMIPAILSPYEKDFTSCAPQFSVFIDKPSYVLVVEVDDDKVNHERLNQIGQEIVSKWDEELQKANPEYKIGREQEKISLPKVLWVKYNTLTTGIRDYSLKKNKGSGANQLKSQLIMTRKKKDIIRFVKENELSTSQ